MQPRLSFSFAPLAKRHTLLALAALCMLACAPGAVIQTSGTPQTAVTKAATQAEGSAQGNAIGVIDRSVCGLPQKLIAEGWPRTLAPTSKVDPLPLQKDDVTFAVLPDTQYYASCRERHMAEQTRYLAGFAKQHTLLSTLFLGDLTEHNTEEEWLYVTDALSLLPKDVPTVVASGNHDYGDNGSANVRATLFDSYLSNPTPATRNITAAQMRSESWENAYYRIPWNHAHLGILVLEWSPRTQTVAWAKAQLEAFPHDRVIFITHAYMYYDDTRYDWNEKGESQDWNPLSYGTAKKNPKLPPTEDNRHPEGAYDGEMLWRELLRSHPGVFLTLNGHVLGDGTALLSSEGDHKNITHQMLCNYQMLEEGGLGYLRLLSINSKGTQLAVKTYSPSLDLYATDASQTFTLPIVPPLGPKTN